MKDCTIKIVTIPKYVEYICPHCEEEVEKYYDEFCNKNGLPPEWNNKLIECEHCQNKVNINNVYWD